MSESDSSDFDLEDLHTRLPPLPGHKDHYCTDKLTLVLFLLALIGQIRITIYGLQNADMRLLTRGYDYQGRMCSEENGGRNVMWCVSRTGEALLDSPICVDECPQGGTNRTHSCYNKATGDVEEHPDYPTIEIFRYCMPIQVDVLAQVLEIQANSTGIASTHHMASLVRQAGMVGRSWLVLLIAANAAVLVGYSYLLLLDKCAKWLVYICEVVFFFGCLGFGIYMIVQKHHTVHCDGSCDEAAESSAIRNESDPVIDYLIGLGMIALAFIGLCLFCIANAKMDVAVGCIEATCECIFEEPTLLLEPFISLTSKVFIFLLCVPGLIRLIATGNVTLGGSVYGFARAIEHSFEEKLYIIFQLFMVFWLVEVCHAVSQYTLAWTTQMWYFTPYINGRKLDHQRCAVFRAYGNAMRYHLGTLALGGLLSGLSRPLRYSLGLVLKVAQEQCNLLNFACGQGLSDAYRRNLGKVDKTAYMDVAITSSNYLVGADRASAILAEEVKGLDVLNGAQMVFQVALIALLTFIGFFGSRVLMQQVAIFNDLTSPHYVEDPEAVSVTAGIVSAIVGVSFTLVFDTVGDTILYCFATEQRRRASFDPSRYSTPKVQQEEEVGVLGWLFGAQNEREPEDEADEEEKPVNYAPQRLRDLISKADPSRLPSKNSSTGNVAR